MRVPAPARGNPLYCMRKSSRCTVVTRWDAPWPPQAMQSGTIRDFHDGLSGRIGNDAAIITQTRPRSEYSMRAGLPGRVYERQWGRKGSVMQAQSNIFCRADPPPP